MLVHGAFEKARRYIITQSETKEKLQEKISQGICITISRQAGAGANTVSDILIDLLKSYRKKDTPEWTSFDKNLIEKVIEDHHLPGTLAKIIEENKLTAVSSIVDELVTGLPDTWALIHKTFETILQLAQMGNVIIIGRGANFLTANNPFAFHVRLTAPIEERVKHVESHFNITHKEALDAVKKDDIDRKNFVRKFFHKEIEDPVNYDIIINTCRSGLEGSAKIIRCAVMGRFQSQFAKD